MTEATITADQISYDDLYARWERNNWSATEIDFSVDREHWRTELSDFERRAALWLYSMFLHGEHQVADTLSPYIDAAPRAEQKYFLTTQQVDEARHSVLFARFMQEVVGQGEDVGSTLQVTSGELTWGFRRVFARLGRTADELRRDPSKPNLAKAITLYHLVVEAMLGQSGQHLIEESLSSRSLLPGLCEGIRNVANDEQRHIAFGVKMIADLVREDPDCEPAVEAALRGILPFTSTVFVPPGGDERYVTVFGFELEDLYAQGAASIEARLRSAGLDPERMQIPLRSSSMSASTTGVA